MPTTLHVVESLLCNLDLPPYISMDLHVDLFETFGEKNHPPQLQLLEFKLQ
jgi:hypothetical protein